MVDRKISKDLKECALRLWDHRWELEDIRQALGVSWISCFCWQQIFKEHGAVEKPPSPLIGCTRTITWALLTAIQDLFEEESDLYLDEVCTWLAFEHDIIISPSALSHISNKLAWHEKFYKSLLLNMTKLVNRNSRIAFKITSLVMVLSLLSSTKWARTNIPMHNFMDGQQEENEPHWLMSLSEGTSTHYVPYDCRRLYCCSVMEG